MTAERIRELLAEPSKIHVHSQHPCYGASADGRCWSRIKRVKTGSTYIKEYTAGEVWHELRGNLTDKGYRQIRTEKRRMWQAHRFIWECLSQSAIPAGLEINHISGVKSENHISNLELCTASENQRHAIRIGLKPSRPGEQSASSLLTDSIVAFIRTSNLTNIELGKMFGVTSRCIAQARYGASWKHIPIPFRAKESSAKLTPDQVQEIRSLVGTMLDREIGARYGVTDETVRKIRHGSSWKALPVLSSEVGHDTR